MSLVLPWLEDLVSLSFLALGLATLVTWLQTRDLKWGRLALAVVLVSAIQVTGWLYGFAGGAPPLVQTLLLVPLLSAGLSIFFFRDSLTPVSPFRRSAVVWVARVVLVTFLVSVGLSRWKPSLLLLEEVAALAGFVLWFALSVEASIQFWRVSRHLPAVQRARMRCLSVGIGGFAVDAVISQLGVSRSSESIQLGVHLAGLIVVGLIYVSYNPPRVLRRIWREPELERYRTAMDELLMGGDPTAVVAGALAWAVRLVGGVGGVVASPAGDVLHTLGLTPDLAERLGREVGSARVAASGWAAGPGWIALPLPTDREARLLAVAAGTLTPLFASDEILLLQRYITSVGVATERARLVKDLADQQQEHAELLQTISDFGIGLIVSTGAHVTHVNGAFARITGFRAEDLNGANHGLMLATRGRHNALTGNMAIDPGGLSQTEMQVVTKDGRTIDIDTTAMIQAANGVRRTTGMIRDITERKRIEEQLRQSDELLRSLNAELELRVAERTAANQELEAFSYSVSHDLRAPLRAIHGFVEALVEDHREELSAGAREYLDYVADNAKQMGRLIDDLLQFSRMSRQLPNRHRTYPRAIVKEVLNNLRGQLEGRDVRFKIGRLPSCRADPSLLAQAYTNLLSNAIKFTRTREIAEIEVGHCRSNGEVVYLVRDNGVGFDPAYQDKLFGVFQRLHRAEEFEGTGVGLAIVQRVVQRHGGRVWAESRLGEGAVFFFTLGGEQAATE